MRRVVVVVGALLVFAALSGACSAPSPATPRPDSTSAGSEEGPYQLLIAASDIAVGEARFIFVIIGPDGGFVDGADISVDFLRPGDDSTAGPAFTEPAAYRVLQVEEPHVHKDGARHIHLEARGVYVVDRVPFDSPGIWSVRARGVDAPEGPIEAGALFQVAEQSITPAIGSPAPRSESATARGIDGLDAISTREPPVPSMYRMTIGEAVSSGRPALVAFSTPAYCQSRICGPVLEGIVRIMPAYEGRVEFVHVEPYDLDTLRSGGGFRLVPAALEWGIPTEPWVFIVDAHGDIAAKFEGIVTSEELEAALDAVLAS